MAIEATLVLRGCKMERWDDLKLFLAVAREGTLTAAGEDLGVNASTVHRRLAAMEEDLGVVLFEKGPRGYRLTAAGETLLPRAEEVEEAIYAASRTVVEHDRNPTGDVRLTLVSALVHIVAPHLVAFHETCPGVRPVLAVSTALLDIGRTADVALRMGGNAPDHAIARRLATVAWCRYAPVHAEGELPWIHYVDADHIPAVRWRKRAMGEADSLMQVDQVTAMHRLLHCVRAQGLLPCHLADPDPRLRRIGDPIPEAATSLWLLIHADLRKSARVRALVDFLVPRLLADRPLFEGRAPDPPH